MNKRQQWRFALSAFKRDIYAGELRVLALALVVAVASVSAVGFFTDRIGRAMERQAADVIAADLLASSGFVIPEEVKTKATALQLNTAEHITFPSMVLSEKDETLLVAIKAVTPGYPLRGALQLSTISGADTAQAKSSAENNLDSSSVNNSDTALSPYPAPGTLWIDTQLKNALALEQGDTLTLGVKRFTVEQLILYEPDRGQNVFDVSPRVMMNAADLPASKLLGEGSRARYSLLMSGEDGPLNDMSDWLAENQASELRVQSVREGSPQMQRALNRAQTFLGLASVVTVLLAGAAIALAVRQFALRQADASAVLRTLGASRAEVITWLVLRLSFITLLASVIGVAIGWFAQVFLAQLLQEWFKLALPAPSWWPPVVGTLTAFVAVAGFGLLPVLRAGKVEVMRVLQRDYAGLNTSALLTALFGLVATYVVVFLQSKNVLLSAIVVLGVVLMLLTFALFGRLIIRGIRQLAGRRFRLSVAGLQRRVSSSIIQLAAFAMGIMALLLISIVRVDVLAAWEQDVPKEAPNVFVVNIQPDQVEGLEQHLAQEDISITGIFPMVRGRLVAHNGEPILQDEDNSQQLRRARREYNLSYSDTAPVSGEIVEGEWWPSDGSAKPSLSLEEDWANDNGYKVGDSLTFKIAGVESTATVANLRKIDWESFEVNFFIVASQSMLEGMPATFVTSFYNETDFGRATSSLVRAFPGVAALDVGAIITRVKALMDRASMAVEYVFAFTLLAGFCVLLAAVQSSQNERIRESALLRAIGASHQQISRAVVTEFAILGAIAGLLAALFATAIAWALCLFVFELPFHINVWLWIVGVFGGAIGISAAGYLATRRVLSTPPLVALRYTT